MLIGYARVSTNEQNSRLQIDALQDLGCARIFVDEGVSGAAVIKPQLAAALAEAQPGRDTIVVWRLDRLGRSTRDMIDAVELLRTRGVGVRSIKEAVIDTTTPTGNLIFQIFAVLAEYERGVILERTKAGIATARKAGTRFGRPPSVTERQWTEAKTLLSADPPRSIAAVATLLGVSRQAIYRRIERDDAEAATHAAAAGLSETPITPGASSTATAG